MHFIYIPICFYYLCFKIFSGVTQPTEGRFAKVWSVTMFSKVSAPKSKSVCHRERLPTDVAMILKGWITQRLHTENNNMHKPW